VNLDEGAGGIAGPDRLRQGAKDAAGAADFRGVRRVRRRRPEAGREGRAGDNFLLWINSAIRLLKSHID